MLIYHPVGTARMSDTHELRPWSTRSCASTGCEGCA